MENVLLLQTLASWNHRTPQDYTDTSSVAALAAVWATWLCLPLYLSIGSLLVLGGGRFWVTAKADSPWNWSLDDVATESAIVLQKIIDRFRIFEVIRLGATVLLIVLVATIAFQETVLNAYHLLLVALVYIALLSTVVSVSPKRRQYLSYHISAIHLSGLIVLFWRNVVPLASSRNPLDASGSSQTKIWALLALLSITGFVIPVTVPRLPSRKCYIAPHPSETASYASYFFFSYMDHLIFLGNKKSTLNPADLPGIHEIEKAEYMKSTAYEYFDPVQNGCQKARMIRGIILYFRNPLSLMLLGSIIAAANNFALPIATLKLLSYLESGDKSDSVQPWVWILWLTTGPIILSQTLELMILARTHVRVRMEVLLQQLIFTHVLRVRVNTASTETMKNDKSIAVPAAAVNATPSSSTVAAAASTNGTTPTAISETRPGKVKQITGNINNLLTVDINNIMGAVDLQPLGAVFSIIISFTLLYFILGWSSLVGIAITIISLPVPAYLVKLRRNNQRQVMKKSDERLQVVTQALNVLRMIKLFGWEPRIATKIAEIRAVELRYIRWANAIDSLSKGLADLFPLASMIATYSCYTLVMKQPLNASVIFSSITLFDTLRNNMRGILNVAPDFIKAKVSIDRFTAFLESGEYVSELSRGAAMSNQQSVEIRNADFFWRKDHSQANQEFAGRIFRLRVEGSVSFMLGKINLITGPTGCGKTSLLYALLGEMVHVPLSENSRCSLPREQGIAYAAQESWVMNETIKANILFGSQYDEERYQEVLRQTALIKDLALFDAGDLTEVGEKGVTLSGGQKARITLARALYSHAQTLLLDDILSSLDVHTAKWIVDECLAGDLIKGRTVILVTHNILLANTVASFAVLLGGDGTIKSQGPIDSLLRQERSLRDAALEDMKTLEKDAAKQEKIDQSADASEARGKLIVAEEVQIGHVRWPAMKLYSDALGGTLFCSTAYGFFILAGLGPICQKLFLGYWSSQYDGRPIENVHVERNLLFYALICIGALVCSVGSYLLYLSGVIRASASIHAQLVHSMLTSTLRWLDTTPLSRMIVRCSADTNAVDNAISNYLHLVIIGTNQIFFMGFTAVYIAGWQMVIPALICMSTALWLGNVYMHAQLPLKRLSSNAQAPVLGQIHTALASLVSVRAYDSENAFQNELVRRLDAYSKIRHSYFDINRWIGTRIDALGAIFSGATATWLIYGSSARSAEVGVTLTLIAGINRLLLMWVRFWNWLEIESNSLERIHDYLTIEHEPPATEQGKPPAYWPSSGSLSVKNLSAKYASDGPVVLKDVSFQLKSGARMGVVGRTGAGKSTLSLALLRAIPTSGVVMYDGMDASSLNLDALRQNITIIPQNPELLAGTLRENLDPLLEHDDAVLNNALDAAGLRRLKDAETHDRALITLDSIVEGGGLNFSQGQRQIIALARAFVRRSKLLVMDEATAAIDYETDIMIQTFIRNEFKESTIITVAHRLQTIMNSDTILVLDAGRVAELAPPKELLLKNESLFKALVDESPDKIELYRAAGL